MSNFLNYFFGNDDNEEEKEINKNDKDIKEEENDNKEIEINKSEKEIIWPENEDEENKQIQLALKESEEEAKMMYEKEIEEERQFQIALKESEKYNYNYNYNYDYNDINDNIDINNILNSKNKEEEFDEEYGICPITQEYMENPVLSPSGNYYEKSAIINWIEKHNTDPLTREHLTVDMLIEDEEYKKQIINYRKKFNK